MVNKVMVKVVNVIGVSSGMVLSSQVQTARAVIVSCSRGRRGGREVVVVRVVVGACSRDGVVAAVVRCVVVGGVAVVMVVPMGGSTPIWWV